MRNRSGTPWSLPVAHLAASEARTLLPLQKYISLALTLHPSCTRTHSRTRQAGPTPVKA